MNVMAQIRMRNVYARFSPDYLRQAASALEFDDLEPMKRRKA